MDWRDLPAGPELDILIAERVLGWSNCHIGPTYRKAMGIPPEQLAKQPPDRTINFPCHHYSQAIGCAWEVVEAMEKRGWFVVLSSRITWTSNKLEDWRVEFHLPMWRESSLTRSAESEGLTAPLAICRAALVAMEVAHG